MVAPRKQQYIYIIHIYVYVYMYMYMIFVDWIVFIVYVFLWGA